LGDETLRAQLTQEPNAYTALLAEPDESRASVVYRRVEDIVTHMPSAPFEHVVLGLAYDYAFTVPELLKRYPRLQSVYEQSRRSEMDELRRQIKIFSKVGCFSVSVTDLQKRLQAFENLDWAVAGGEQQRGNGGLDVGMVQHEEEQC
jgi:hypothetical protein